MYIDIKNIGLFREIDEPIKFDGITLIVGENNTGKSTISKVLYAVFSSLYDYENKIDSYLHSQVYRYLMNVYNDVEYILHGKSLRNIRQLSEDILSKPNPNIEKILKEFEDEYNYKVNHEVKKQCVNRINKILSENKNSILSLLTERTLLNIFDYQICNLNCRDELSRIILNIRRKNIVFDFFNNNLKNMENNDVTILHDAIYYNGPSNIDKLSNRLFGNYEFDVVSKFIPKNNYRENYENLEFLKKIENLFYDFDYLGNLLIDFDKNSVAINGLNEPVKVSQLSSGLKTMVALKNLLYSGNIIDEDILILDEPEINLHPDWQIKLAEILVKLQKLTSLTILISTHSPYFLNAIDTYSYKYNLQNKCHYYLTENNNMIANIKCIDDNVERAYDLLSKPFDMLLEERRKLLYA